MKIIGLVPARKGSKRFPGKNLVEWEGETLTARAVKQSCRIFPQTVLSTDHIIDDTYITEYQRIIRPASLTEEDTPMYAVVLHAALNMELNPEDFVCLLQPTCPLRTDGEIMRVVARSISTGLGYYSTNVPVAKKEMPPNGSIYCLKVSQWGAMERTKHESHEVGIGMYLGREEIDVNTPDDLARAEAIAKG